MPIVIDEVTLTVNVEDSNSRSRNGDNGDFAYNPDNDHRAAVAACTAQVLDILNQKKER